MKKLTVFLSALLMAGFGAAAQRIAVLSDIHVTPGNAADSALRVAVDQINHEKLDGVIVNGDITNEGSDVQLRNVDAILSGIRHPLYVLPAITRTTGAKVLPIRFPRFGATTALPRR